MRYFKIVLACFGFILAVVGITAGVLFLTGKFDKEVIQPGDIAFEITEKLTENDFEVVVNTTTENVTEKDVTLSLTNQTEADGMISDGIITIPKVVKLGKPFTVKVNKTHYAGMTEEWNVGGTSIIRAKSTNPLIQEATPLTVEVDVPVHSLGVELVTTTGTKIGTVSARNLKNYMKTLAEGEEDKKVVELAVGSVVRLQPVFTPAKSAKTTKGEPRKVLFEIPTAWKGIHIDFVDGENDLIEVLRQTTVEDIKINAYCFRTSADEYVAQSKGYSDEELITMMNSNGISGASSQIFGTNQKITSFTSSTNDEYLNLAINSPMTLVANGKVDNAFDLGLGLASDAGVAKLEDKIAVIKLFAYWQNGDGAWEDAGDKLEIVGQTSSKKENGVKAKINKNDANLSSWKVIASETGKYKIVAKLSYEYYSSSSSVPTEINFEIPFNNILVADPISSDVAWKSTLPAIKTLVVLDGETAAEKYYPTINLADFVDIKNPNATYKVVRFFAYSTEGENLANVINCSLYSGNFAVPDSSNQYEVFEIPNGILTAKDVGNFRIFFATVVSDYMGNPKIQFGGYLFESFSNTNTINVVKSLKQLDASMTVNQQEDGKDYNKNTDETTRDYIFHVRQQDEKVFTLSLFVSDIEIFERDYADGKISIDFLLDGQKSKILELTGDYVIDIESKRIDFQVSVKSLPNNDQPTLECKVTYDLDHRLDKFVSNNGNKVQIKVLNGFAQEIVFDAVKDANPRNSAENPIQVEIKFNAGSDNVATNVEYGITLNEQKLILEDLSKVTINEEALNKTYTLSSNKPAVIAVEDDPEKGPKLSILGATEDEDVIITATAADGSGLTANLYFRVLASLQITLTPNKSEITMDGYQGSQTNFRTYFDAKAGDIDLNNLLEFNVPIENNDKFVFADDTLKVVSTLGRDASLQLYITSNFGFTKVIPIRIVSNITASNTYANNDNGLDDSDFVARGETPPTERGTRVYAENSREITFVLTQEKPTQTNISISVDDFELPKNGGIQNISYNNGILTVCFDAVSQMTEKTIIFKKNFSENDEYAFVYTMKFLVFPNIKASLVSNVGTEENPASYVCGETVVYDAKDNSNGLIKLERIMGSNIISEHATLEARINGEWVALSSNSGVFTLPTSFRAIEGSFVEIRITYDGCVLTPIKLFFKPFFDESILLDAKVLYNGKRYVPFVATENNSIALSQAEGVVYTIINATSEQYLRIRANQIEKLDRLYTKIIASEKLRIENGNGVTELPILILPIKYPFVVYDSIENAESEETYRNVDLKQVVESESFYDTLEAGSEEIIDLKSKILVDGLESGGALVSVINADGSANNYVNYDAQNLTISANSVGKDQIVYVKVKCGAEFEEAFEFVYRIKVTANQQIKVFYPYIEYNEEYNVQNAYEYLYFGSKNQVSVDLMEEFDAQKTPNKKLLEELFPTTNGQTYARRFVVVREKDGKLIPIEYKDLHFEIASVGIGKTVIPADQVSNYVTITEKTTTNGVLQSANMFVNRGQSVETIDIRIRAFTSSGAEAYYRFQVNDKPISYTTYYKNQKIDYDGFSVASDGASEINLNENVDVRVGENPQQPVSPNEYKFYLIVHEKLGTDYSQFITLSGGIIQISTLVNDVETTVVIYNNKGEISRFNLVLKCTIDHEIISTTVNDEGFFDIGNSVDFFNATSADGNYSMQEITTRVYVRNYLNGTDIGSTSANNLFVNVGGYSIKDISKRYNQYVLIDNLKVYAENLMDTWKGKFYLGDDAKYDVLTEGKKSYIRYNGSVIEVEEVEQEKVKKSVVKIPLQSITDGDTVAYEVKTEDITGAQYVIIPHLKFSNGNDTRDYVLYDRVFHEKETDPAKKYTNEPFVENRDDNYTTYVNAYVNGYIRYKVDRSVDSNGKIELKAAILRLTHNNVQYVAQVDKEHFDHEYITIDNEKHYFTRFYTISYDGIAANKDGVTNVPKVRYMLGKDETTIDLSKIIFYTQEGISNNVLKLGGTNYISNMFKFYVDDGSEESSEITFSKDDAGNNTWQISRESNNKFSPINIMIKDTTGKYVVGRLTILPTVETSTSETESNQTIFIEAGDTTKVDYQINAAQISVDDLKQSIKNCQGENALDLGNWSGLEYYYKLGDAKDWTASANGTIPTEGLAAWFKVETMAKKYFESNVELSTTLAFDNWKFGDFKNKAYANLTGTGEGQFGIVFKAYLYNNSTIGRELTIDSAGVIQNIPYGSTIIILAGQNFVPTIKENWKTYVANDEISDKTFVEFGTALDYTEKYNNSITLSENEEFSSWIKKFTDLENGKATFVDNNKVKIETSEGDVEYMVTISGGIFDKDGNVTLSEVAEGATKRATITFTREISKEYRPSYPKALEQEGVNSEFRSEPKSIDPLDISNDANLSTFLGDVSLSGLTASTLGNYDIYVNDLKMESTTIGNGETTTYSIRSIEKENNGEIKVAKTGLFYVVNQEADSTKVHMGGNVANLKLKELSEILAGTTWDVKSSGFANVGPVWVYPMTTKKYLSDSKKKELLEDIKDWWGINSEIEGWSTTDLFADERKGLLETAAEILNEKDSNSKPTNRDPFNTATIYQHGYAIGNIHIYLEDYVGDQAAADWMIYTSSEQAKEVTGSENAWSRVIETNGSTIRFVIGGDGCLTTTLKTKEFSEQIKNINIFTDDQIKALSEQKTVEIADKNDESITYSYKLSSGAKLTQDETTEEWTLIGKIIKTTKTGDFQIIYLTQNAKMTDNKYLFENGLLVEWDGINKNIVLRMVNKGNKIEFAFNGVKFEATAGDGKSIYKPDAEVPVSYFEGLEDRVEQPTNSKIEEGSKTYKAEKTGDVVGYKDKIEKDMFNFDKWEYSASYVNENGTTIQATIIDGKSIKIVGLSKTNTQLKITVSGISEEGGDYTFVVDLNQNPAVTIIGGNESITSPDTPFDGGVLTGGQEKIVELDKIFKINAKESPVEIKNYEGNPDPDNESLLQVLYDNLYLYYLVGKLNGYSSNVFKITKDENSGQNIISIIFTGAEEQEFTIVKDADGKFSLVDKEGNPVDGNFVLELNTDLYEFSAAVNEPKENGSTGDNGNSPEGGTTPTNEGDSGSGGSSAEGGEQPQPTTIKVLKITITPVFTYQYQVESNIKLIAIKDTNNFAQTGQLTITGGEIKTESVVKLRFSVLRGNGADAKEVAFAYYSLSLKPSVGAVVSYPTISTSTKDEKGNFIQDKQTTEYFYAGAGEFDINAKSTISSGEAPRMAVTKYAYGTATVGKGKEAISYPCVATYLESHKTDNLTIIKIGDTDVTNDKLVTTGTIETDKITAEVNFNEKTYSISLYKPSQLNISYTASSNQNIIKGKDEDNNDDNNDILTNSLKNANGKFTFDMTGVTVSEAEVVISAQATIGSYTYTFAQYTFTVCKNPVISTLVTTDPTHLDGNGAEILPINGGDSIKPFDISSQDSYGYVGGVPRLQFVYNNLILSSDYYGSFEIKDKKSKVKVNEYQILQTATGEGTVYFVFNKQSVSGSYSYKTVWDYRMNPTLDSHTIMDNYDPENTSELLNYYYLNAGKAYNIIETFGLTKYFSTESLTEIFDLGFDNSEIAAGYEGVKFTADGKSINILGAPEGGMNFRIKFKPYGSAEFKTIGITILPSIEIVVNYRTETIYENDPYAYGLISSGTTEYELVKNKRGCDFSIERNGVLADVTKNDYTIEIVANQTDASLGVSVEQDNESAKLFIKNPPQLNAKRVVIKISDNYGYTQYLRYVVGAKTQVVISSNDITFTTGGNIEWDKNNQFPISFKKSGEETIQLSSFYEAIIPGAKESTEEVENVQITTSNISDNYGDASSLRATTGNDGKVYGVQLDSVITYTTSVDESEVSTYYIPYNGKTPISYDVYKLIAKDKEGNNVVLKSFDKYSKVEIYKGNSITADYMWIKGGPNPTDWPLDDKGALTPIQDVSQYTIKLYSSSSSADGTIQFILLEVNKTDNLYYASRENPTDYYAFDYEIKINGEGSNIVDVDGKTINNIGNAQYGSASSLNTTLKIGVYSSYAMVNTSDNTFKIGETTYSISYNSDGDLEKIYYKKDNTTEVSLTIVNNIVTIGETTYQLIKHDKTVVEITKFIDNVDIGILLKFGIYPEVKQTVGGQISYDYVGLGDNIHTVLTNKEKGIKLVSDTVDVSGVAKSYSKVLGEIVSATIKITYKDNSNTEQNLTITNDKFTIGETEYTISYKADGTIDKITYKDSSNTERNLTIKDGKFTIDTTEYTISNNFEKMGKGTLSGNYSYNQTTRVLSLKAGLTSDTATINNIKYTYDSTNKTLKIGYRVVPLTDGQFVDDVTGITYKVDGTQLLISKKIDNANTVTINNIKYTVETSGATPTVKYETLYESIFVVWQYENNKYWAQWNYKVVDKFNQVITDDPLEAQDGNIKVKLDWTREVGDATYRFNANTLELFKDTEKLGTAKWVSDINGNRYEIDIKINSTTTTYTIEIKGDTMKFKNGESYYQVGSTELALEEETKQNSSWADKIKLTGLDGGEISLNDAANIIVKVGGNDLKKVNGKYTIDGKGLNLAGESLNLQIFYKSKIKEDGLTLTAGYYEKLLKFNGNEIKVTFEHFTVPTNA